MGEAVFPGAKRRLQLYTALVSLTVLLPAGAFAQSTWTGAGGNDFSDGSNWDTAPVAPGSGDAAVIPSGTPTAAGSAAVETLDVSGGTLKVEADLSVSAGTTIFDPGRIEVSTGGELVSNVLMTGGYLGVSGILTGDVEASGGTFINDGTVNGEASIDGGTLTNNGTLRDLIINSGGIVTNNATAAVTGATTVNDGTLTSNGALNTVDIGAAGTFTNNTGATAGAVNNAGTTSNAGAISSLTNTAGSFTNGTGGTITGRTTVAGGTVTNNFIVTDVDVAAAANFVNNTGATAGAVTNSGTTSNGGTIASLANTGGSFTNNAGGTITGRTSVTGGTVTNNFVVTDVDVAAAAAFVNNLGATAGAIANAGTASNAGTVASLTNTAGMFSNDGGGTITGRTVITGGTVTNSFVVTDVDVAAAAAFVNNLGATAGAVTNAGRASNAGTVAALNNTGGTLSNDAGGTITGTTRVAGGTVTNNFVMTDVDVSATGNFINNSAGTAGAVANAGAASSDGTIASLANTGGTFSNTGTISGSATVTGGTLVNDGTVSGGVAIYTGGMLAGTGSIGGLTVGVGGIVAPGPGFATITVNGDVTFEAGSTYRADTDPSGLADRIAATGTVTIAGGTLEILAGSGTYALSTPYTLLTGSTVTGAFDTVTTDLVFLTPTVTYGPGGLMLEVERNAVDFTQVAESANGRATATAIEGLGATDPLFLSVLSLDAGTADSAFRQLGGEIHASLKSQMLRDSRYASDAILDRFDGVTPTSPVGDASVWMSAVGSTSHIAGDGNAAGLTGRTGGVVAGADAEMFDGIRLGALLGYSHTSAGREADIDSHHAGVYASADWQALTFTGGALYGWNEISTDRTVSFGSFSDHLKANYDAATGQVFGDLAWSIKAGEAELRPFANITYIYLDTDSFAEKGGVAALSGRDGASDLMFATFGMRWSAEMLTEIPITLSGMLGWRHGIGDLTPSSTLAFASGSPFMIEGVTIPRNSAVVEAGITAQLSKTARLKLTYSGEFASGLASHAVKANLTVDF